MKQIIKNSIFAGAFLFLIASPLVTIIAPQPTYAADFTSSTECDNKGVILGIPPWYRGLTKKDGDNCNIVSPSVFATDADKSGLQTFIWKIVLNVIQIVLTITGLVAFFFILYGGFLFLTGGSVASQIEKGRKTILNAVIGLVISMGAIAVTNLIFGLVDGVAPDPTYGIPKIQPDALLHSALNLAFYIAGIIAVIVIIVAGLSYVTSQGDSGRVTKAKNMILYAVIGLVILIVAFAVVNFVILRFQ